MRQGQRSPAGLGPREVAWTCVLSWPWGPGLTLSRVHAAIEPGLADWEGRASGPGPMDV